MAPIAGLGRMSIGLADQQGVGICAGAVGVVADLDAAEVGFGPFLAVFGLTETLARD